MKAFEIQGKFGLENLVPVERPEPEPGPGQVLLKLKAVSLNYRDLLTVNGHYNPRQPLPLIPCSDGVGEIVAVGEGVSRVKAGDRVAGTFAQGWISGPPTPEVLPATTLGGPLDGTLAEFTILEEAGAVRVPDYLSDAEAATLPCAAVTAWSALRRHGNIGKGDTLLTLGTGGVSIFALQFAKMFGAQVIVTSGSDEKRERAKALGADFTINHQSTEDWWKAVRERTGGRGVDQVIELGGAGTLAQSLRCVAMGGHISLIGILSGITCPLDLVRVLMQDIRIQGVIVGPRDTFEEMNEALSIAKLKPVIDRVYPFDNAPAAFEHMASAKHLGKIVIAVSD